MPRLVVRFLGGYRVELDGEPVYGFETDKARALLAYLMVEADRPHRRETLAAFSGPTGPTPLRATTCARRSSGCGTHCRRTAPARLPSRLLPLRHAHRCAVQHRQRLRAST